MLARLAQKSKNALFGNFNSDSISKKNQQFDVQFSRTRFSNAETVIIDSINSFRASIVLAAVTSGPEPYTREVRWLAPKDQFIQ